MDQKIRARNALRESIRRRAAISFGAAITVRSGGKVRCTDPLGVDTAGEQVFDTVIRSSIAYAESAERAKSILDHRPDLGADYLALAGEVLERLGQSSPT